MSKEEEKVELDTKKQDEEVEESSSEETETESNEDENSLKTEKDEVDYKALLQAERERAEKAEKVLAADRYNSSKKRREEVIEDETTIEEDDNKPLTKKDLQTLLLKERQANQKAFEESRALEIARKYTASEDEAQASVLYWKTRVVPTDNLEEDMLFAIGGLNNRKTTARNAELMRALRGKDSINRDTATTHRDAAIGTTPKLSSGDSASYKKAGFAYDNTKKVWTKKLPNGKTLIKDPRTKQTSVK